MSLQGRKPLTIARRPYKLSELAKTAEDSNLPAAIRPSRDKPKMAHTQSGKEAAVAKGTKLEKTQAGSLKSKEAC